MPIIHDPLAPGSTWILSEFCLAKYFRVFYSKKGYINQIITGKTPQMVIIYIILGLALLLFVLSSISPKTYQAERSIRINRPLEEVYQFVSLLRNQDLWAKWNTMDPHMKKTYQGEDGKIGFRSIWESDNKQVGAGQQTITVLDEKDAVYTKLEFFRPFKSESDAYIKTRQVDESTTDVFWGFTGEMRTPMNVMLLFMNMDKMIGKDFEEGLVKLKEVLESRSDEQVEIPST